MADVQTEPISTAIDPPAVDDPAPPVDPTPPTDPVTPADPEPQHWSRNEALGLDSDTVGWLENKGFDNLQATVTSQRELERKLGASNDRIQIWPESDDTEGFDAIYQRLGTPKDAEGYKIEFQEDAQVDPGTLEWFKQAGFKYRLTNEQAQGFALEWNTEVARLQTEQQEALEIQNKTEETELRNVWGTKYDERLDYGHRGLLAHGLDEDTIDKMQATLGPKALAEFAAKVADTMGEDTIAANTVTPAYGTSKEQVQTQINELNGELGADKERFKKYYADQSAPKESTGKDYRKMQQLEAQLEGLIKAKA